MKITKGPCHVAGNTLIPYSRFSRITFFMVSGHIDPYSICSKNNRTDLRDCPVHVLSNIFEFVDFQSLKISKTNVEFSKATPNIQTSNTIMVTSIASNLNQFKLTTYGSPFYNSLAFHCVFFSLCFFLFPKQSLRCRGSSGVV